MVDGKTSSNIGDSMGHFECRQHGKECKSYVTGGIVQFEKDGVTLENIRQKYNEGKVNLEDLFFTVKCLTWVDDVPKGD